MKRRVKFMVVGLMVALVAGLVPLGCAKTAAPTAPVELKGAMFFSASHPRSQAVQYWADAIAKETNGRVKIKWVFDNQLVPTRETFAAASKGVIDVGFLQTAYFTGNIPLYSIMDVPFQVNRDRWMDVMDELLQEGSIFDKMFMDNNLKVLGGTRIVIYQLMGKKPIITPQDIKGMKIRAAGEIQSRMVQLWGGAPVSLDMGGVYDALQKGVVDGTVNSIVGYVPVHFDEVAPYVTMLDISATQIFVVMNLDVWKSLSPQEQKAIRAQARPAMEYSEKLENKADEDSIAQFPKLGVTLHVSTPQEKAAWAGLLSPLREEYIARNGDQGKKVLEILDKYR